jgi:division protein CdvB (Snf7/Vps24/ESCRT-III family)
VLVTFGWIYFYDDGAQMGVGVNRDEVVEESEALAESVSESMKHVGNELDEVGGRDRAESVSPVGTNP